ncbi:MAG: hypothetical protein M0Z95_21015 [Actinomycetota bacterium]|jgi:hypothetical protein|nr:hypothetical protein [Actinomycetota bacterium]
MLVAKVSRISFIVGAVFSGIFLSFWIMALPLIVLESADDGCFASNLSRVWLPNATLFFVATVACVVFAAIGVAYRSRWWILLPASCVTAAVVCMLTVSPLPGCG